MPGVDVQTHPQFAHQYSRHGGHLHGKAGAARGPFLPASPQHFHHEPLRHLQSHRHSLPQSRWHQHHQSLAFDQYGLHGRPFHVPGHHVQFHRAVEHHSSLLPSQLARAAKAWWAAWPGRAPQPQA
uniref:Uncharacterized protein n=1 Tax=Arundo donax TaxID=35708 RepID=A0A0A9UT52_ARUDO